MFARDAWQRFQGLSKQIDDLQKRVAELEDSLERRPGEGCPHCGELAFRVERSEPHREMIFASMGVRLHYLKCEKCGFEDVKTITPSRG